jgi:hypothetical protein
MKFFYSTLALYTLTHINAIFIIRLDEYAKTQRYRAKCVGKNRKFL